MGNPHPTKSKPAKIGRKHTGAITEQRKQGRINYAAIVEKKKNKKMAKYKKEVAAYWNGERDSMPAKPM